MEYELKEVLFFNSFLAGIIEREVMFEREDYLRTNLFCFFVKTSGDNSLK